MLYWEGSASFYGAFLLNLSNVSLQPNIKFAVKNAFKKYDIIKNPLINKWVKKQPFSISDCYLMLCYGNILFSTKNAQRFDTQSYMTSHCLQLKLFCWGLNERAVKALLRFLWARFSLTATSCWASLRCVSCESFRRCAERGTSRRFRELLGDSEPVCVGLTWGRSLGEGLGDGDGRVTWPAVKQL